MTTERFTVLRVLSNLWEIRDHRRYQTEFVLFGDRGPDYVRLVVGDLRATERNEHLRYLAWTADRAGVPHSFRPPPRLSPIVRAST